MVYIEELIDYDVNGKPKKRLLVDSVSDDLAEKTDLAVGSIAYAREETNKVQLLTANGWEAL